MPAWRSSIVPPESRSANAGANAPRLGWTAGRHGGRAAQRSLDRSDGRRHGGAPLVTPPDQPGSRDNGGGLRQPARLLERDSLPSARRVVVKIGSSSLTDQRGRLDDRRID